MAGVATIAGLIVKNAPRCIRRTHDHHVKDSSARLGPVKALRFASPRARAAGLDRASIEPLLGSYVMVAVLWVTLWRRSDKCLTMGAAGTGQARGAPTERREGLSCANAPGK